MQAKYLPLRYAPIEIQSSLSDATEPVVSEQLGNFTTMNTSFVYKLENCMLKCDVNVSRSVSKLKINICRR